MGQLEDLRAFVQIVEQESIGKAAEQAGIAKSAMSRKLRLLEERLDTALIVRTTRQWALTEAGRQYYERGLQVLLAYDEFETEVRNEDQKLVGDIRLSVPLYFGRAVLSPVLLEFAKLHQDVHLNVDFSDRFVDVVGENYDLVVRIAEMPDSTLIARKLCHTRHLFCASPQYIASNPPIKRPYDVKTHRILQYGSSKRPKWTFTPIKGKDVVVPLRASINSHDGGFLIDAAEQGFGIARLPDFMVSESVDAGRLTEILPAYAHKLGGVFVVYPAAKYLPHRTRMLVEFLIAGIGKQ